MIAVVAFSVVAWSTPSARGMTAAELSSVGGDVCSDCIYQACVEGTSSCPRTCGGPAVKRKDPTVTQTGQPGVFRTRTQAASTPCRKAGTPGCDNPKDRICEGC